VAVHAESEELTSRLARRAVAEGRVGVRDYLASRPGAPSSRPSPRAIAFAAETGCALHVVHVSSGRGVALVARGARARGRRDVRDVPALPGARREETPSAWARWPSARRRCATRPSARRCGRRARGDVDLVATDHSPVAAALKEGDDFFAVWGGIAGAQTLLALLYDEGVVGRGLAPEALAELLARRRRGASAWRRPRARSRWAPTPTWPRRPGGDVDGGARGAARPPPAQPLRGPDAARPRGADDPARAHDRARRAVVGEPGGRVVRRGA
jgi:allantoinase